MRKRVMLLMCMAAILVAIFSFGVVGANQEPPDVTVVAARVDNGTALELGLRINSHEDSFQSAGVVLEYDASALTPCGWADEVTDELLREGTIDFTALAEGENVWDHAVPLPTKGKDIISGKTAFTVIDSSTKTGYLYLNVEAPAPTYGIGQVKPGEMEEGPVELTESTPANFGFNSNYGIIDATAAVDQVITVRFTLPAENPVDPEEPPVEPTPDPEEPEPEPNPDETDEPSGQADETGDGNGDGGTGEGGGEPTEPGPTDPTDPENPDNPDPPENPDDPPAETPEDFMAKYKISVAADAIAVNAPAGGNGVYYSTTDIEPAEITSWHFLSVKNGISVNQGGGGPADPSDFFPVVFYDWDGVTMLGSRIVPKSDDPVEQQQLIDSTLADMALQLSANEEQLGGALWYDDTNLPLTNKKGYTFGKWIDFDAKDANGNEVYTNYGKAVYVGDGTQITDIPEPDGHIFSEDDYASGIVLKAAYYSNADIEALAPSDDARRYTVTYDSYLQFGSSNDVGITVHIKRENEGGQGVHRVRKLGLRVGMKIGSTTVYALQQLDNQDDLTTQVAVNNSVDEVTVEVIDLCDVKNMTGTSNWASGAVGRSNRATAVPGGDHTNPGFVNYGIVGFFNDAVDTALQGGDTAENIRNDASTTGITSTVTNAHYTKAGFNITNVQGVSGGAAVRRRGAIANIFEAYASLPADRRAKGLTWDEMQEAITYGITWQDGAWVRK